MPKDIEPKPAIFNGINFKSRLEARWAVLLGACGLPWIYEPETFRISPENWEYTPDFQVRSNTLIEVKPLPPEEDYYETVRAILRSYPYQMAVGIGSFYKTMPEVKLFPRDYLKGFFLTLPTFLDSLGVPNSKSRKAIKKASQYRFDLQ